ncbi:MAG: YdcF family protein [Bacteroidetes bacterium]|nr:YdcF family protein [Bacteroidota bacterium]
MKRILLYILSIGFMGFISIAALVIFSNTVVELQSRQHTYNAIENIPYNEVGLVLGTSKSLANGRVNLYFKYRMEAAARLFNAGKIDYILVSGDNSRRSYNEPIEMQKDLIRRGIPQEKIYLDYAGFRTFDSVLRCKKVFGQTAVTIISQSWHNKRAIFIARHHDIEVVAFNARSVSLAYDKSTRIRELLARVKVLLDIYILNKQPKFLGDPVKIG